MRLLICTLVLMGIVSTASGQCPNGDSLLKRIRVIQNKDTVEQIKELLSYEKKLANYSCSQDSFYTTLLLRISTLYYMVFDFANAIQYSKRAIQIINSNINSPAIRKNDIVRCYYYLTIFYDSLNLAQLKSKAADSCIFYEKKIGLEFRYTCFLMAYKVKDLFFKGEYNLCADYAALGEVLAYKYYPASDRMAQIIFFIAYHANSLNLLKRFAESEAFLQSQKEQFLESRNKEYISVIYNFLGYVSKVKGENQKAIDNFKKAFEFDVRTENKYVTSEALCQLGIMYADRLNEVKTGLLYFHKATKYAKGYDSFYVLGTMAKTFADEKMFDSAYYYFQHAFNSIKPGINENDLLLHLNEYVYTNSVEYVVNTVLDKGDTYLQEYGINHNKGNLEKALNVYKVADKLLNSIKAEQTEVKSRLFWRSYTRRLYEHAIEASYLEKNVDQAFYFFEKSRAVVLNDQLQEQQWMHSNEFLKLAQTRKKILLQNAAMAITPKDSQKLIEMQEEQYESKKELAKMEALIKDRYTMYYQGIIDSGFIRLRELKERLTKGNQSMLEIFSGDSAVYALFITDKSVSFNKIEKSQFEKKVKSYTAYISNFDLLNGDFAGFKKVSNELFDLIFQGKSPKPGRIVISPDAQYFPFESLISNKNSITPIYLLNEHAISYTYSARYLMIDFISDSTRVSGDFMGLAPLHYSFNKQLSALKGSNTSLEKIGSYFDGSVYKVGGQATKTNFQQQFTDYKIVQLYTHSADSSNNNEPVIYFADSALYLSELIPERKPATQLIVLSACETGKGEFYKGEGVFSFNRGFAAIGVPSAVTNLWAVDSKSTYELTEIFYKYLSKGLPLDIALQKAKLEFINSAGGENRLPYYWAAPILVGKTDPIVLDKPFAWKYLFAGIGLAGIIFFGWKKIKNRSSLAQLRV